MKVKRWQIHLTLGYLPLRLPIPYLYQIDTDTDTNFQICIIPIGILIPVTGVVIVIWYHGGISFQMVA